MPLALLLALPAQLMGPAIEASVLDGRELSVRYRNLVLSPGAWPRVDFPIQSGTLDLSGWEAMRLTIIVEGNAPVPIGVRLTELNQFSATEPVQVSPRREVTLVVPLQKPFDRMAAISAQGKGVRLRFRRQAAIDLSQISQVSLYGQDLRAPVRISLLRVQLIPRESVPDVLLDRFGQYTGAVWPKKVTSTQELLGDLDREANEDASQPEPTDRDSYGGWAMADQRRKTGRFHFEKTGGQWWFVDPEGFPFLSLGVCEVDPESAASDGSNAYRKNLELKYGREPIHDWAHTTERRLRRWGFNSAGAWCDPAFLRAASVPQPGSIGLAEHTPAFLVNRAKMPDPFDPQFPRNLQVRIGVMMGSRIRPEWVYGYFVDNELPWGRRNVEEGRYDVFRALLGTDGGKVAAKAEWVRWLAAKFGNLAEAGRRLDRPNWNQPSDWLPRLDLPPKLSDAWKAVGREFTTVFARRYFALVGAEIKRQDPDGLYLGSRFSYYTPEVLQAAAEWCDALSFNIYRRQWDPDFAALLPSLNKPVLISEYSVGAADTGVLGGGVVNVQSQAERAEVASRFLRDALMHPQVVGVHWYQWVDQPVQSRRFDDENHNVGLVMVTDRPYAVLTGSIRSTLFSIYRDRSQSPQRLK